jgi:hypothetical protein
MMRSIPIEDCSPRMCPVESNPRFPHSFYDVGEQTLMLSLP